MSYQFASVMLIYCFGNCGHKLQTQVDILPIFRNTDVIYIAASPNTWLSDTEQFISECYLLETYVGSPCCQAEMYAGRVACCPW